MWELLLVTVGGFTLWNLRRQIKDLQMRVHLLEEAAQKSLAPDHQKIVFNQAKVEPSHAAVYQPSSEPAPRSAPPMRPPRTEAPRLQSIQPAGPVMLTPTLMARREEWQASL